MKTLIVQPWIRNGGAELISVQLALELERRGETVGIVCTYVDPKGLPAESRALRYALPAPWLSRLCQRSRTAFLLLGPWLLLRLTWRHSRGVDVINPHNFPASWVAVIVGALRGIPVVWTCNEPPERLPWRDARKVGLGDFLGWRLASCWIDRLLIRRVARIYVPSEMTRRQVRLRYGVDAAVVHLGVDRFFLERARRNGLIEKLGLEGKFVLLSVGKLHPQKNQRVCIQALETVLERIPNVVLLLAGDGPMAKPWAGEAIRVGVARHVRFLGSRDPEEVRDFYGLCNVNLLPATNQSWGLTPFEALGAEKISVVSSDCGAAEVIREQGIGIVCEPTSEAFAEKILEIHERPRRFRSMARKGRSFVARNLTWSRYADEVEGLLRDAGRGGTNGAARTAEGRVEA